jgi:anti-sigma factor RsiW
VSEQSHREFSDGLGAYVLGALSDDERTRMQAHIASCPRCHDDVVALQATADLIPAAVPQIDPPAGLKQRIMRVVESEAELLAAAGSAADRPQPRRRRRRGLAPRWLSERPLAAALAAAALAVVGVVGFALGGSGTTPTARTVEAFVDPTVAPGASASVAVSSRQLVLRVARLPAPPSGHIYEVWLQRRGRPPAPTNALFGVSSDGSGSAVVGGDLHGVQQVLVTAEPDGGSLMPTRSPIITADVA